MDQQFTDNGEPYGPTRYKELVKECYLISKFTHTSYIDVLKISPLERQYLIEFLIEEAQTRQAQLEKQQRKQIE